MKHDILHRDKVQPELWAEILKMSETKEKPGIEAFNWAKDCMSKAELNSIVIYEGQLYRPIYEINHPKHQFNYLLDFETAQAITKAWNKLRRPKHDRVEMAPVLFSSNNNKEDYRK